MNTEEKAFEEAKRKYGWDSVQHWKAFQAMLAFIDSQQPVPRNSKAGCLAKQAKLLKSLETSSGSGE